MTARVEEAVKKPLALAECLMAWSRGDDGDEVDAKAGAIVTALWMQSFFKKE